LDLASCQDSPFVGNSEEFIVFPKDNLFNVADAFIDTNAASLDFPQDDITLTNFIYFLAALTNFHNRDPPALHAVAVTNLEDDLFDNISFLSPFLMQAFQGTNDVLTLLTNTGFLDVHEDLQFYNLIDASPSSNKESDDTATEESPVLTEPVQDNLNKLFLTPELSCLNTTHETSFSLTLTEAPPDILAIETNANYDVINCMNAATTHFY
jgi:hypothetical protein